MKLWDTGEWSKPFQAQVTNKISAAVESALSAEMKTFPALWRQTFSKLCCYIAGKCTDVHDIFHILNFVAKSTNLSPYFNFSHVI